MGQWAFPTLESPDGIALIAQDRALTYAEIELFIRGMCYSLKELGVRESMRIAFLGKADLSTTLLFLALWRLKAIACPLNTRWPKQAIDTALQKLSADHFIEPPPLSKRAQGFDMPLDLDQVATFLFTSGTSGLPKIATHRLRSYYFSALGSNCILPVEPGDCWCLSLPLFHVGGLAILFRCWMAGAAVQIADRPLSQLFCTHFSLVLTQLYRLAQEEAMRRAKALVIGGAPLSLQPKSLPIFPTYGMTEMSSMITLSGNVLPYREVRIAEDKEIFVRGRVLFSGYDGHPPLPEGDWFATGDLGQWKEEKLEIIGRKDNLFISGGENIQPEEIEHHLLQIPGILNAVVVPLPDEEFGMRPIAFVEQKKGLSEKAIQEALSSLLPKYKIPLSILPFPTEQEGLKPNRSMLKAFARVQAGSRE